jgi:hypothetical protein
MLFALLPLLLLFPLPPPADSGAVINISCDSRSFARTYGYLICPRIDVDSGTEATRTINVQLLPWVPRIHFPLPYDKV